MVRRVSLQALTRWELNLYTIELPQCALIGCHPISCCSGGRAAMRVYPQLTQLNATRLVLVVHFDADINSQAFELKDFIRLEEVRAKAVKDSRWGTSGIS